jgi:hypothetical protein
LKPGRPFAANGWTDINGSQINKWYVGSVPTGYTGARCAFISKNGTSHSYSVNLASVTHIYRDITFPAGQDQAVLSFSWKGYGESGFDYMKVYLVPTSTIPAGGAELISGQIGTTYNVSSAWTSNSITVCGVAGTTQRLVFSWVNDALSGLQPPIALDNVSLVSSVVGSSCSAVLGTGVTTIYSLPYTSGTGTTQSAVNDITSANAISCGSSNYFSGEDQVWEFTPTVTGQVTITLISSGSYTGLMLYNGCPASNVCSGTAGTCVAYNQSPSGSKSMCVTVNAGDTYYLLLDSYASPSYNPYSNLAISAPLPSSSSNDLPCDATSLTLGINVSGDNSCAGSASDPTLPACWVGGTSNTVWYSVVCPASGDLRIRTISGTLTDTQIGLYSGNCSALTTNGAWCNDNAPACGTSAYDNSELIITSGLTPGNTYYIVVDGAANDVGTFYIQVTDGSQPVVPAAGQDCSSTNPVCAQSLSVGNPGYAAYGNVCDFPGGGPNCLTAGERSSAWYEIDIASAGTLLFDIVPNDWPGTGTVSTDYDFAVWKTGGTGAVTCAQIAAGGAIGAPLKCNYSPLGVTGLSASGNAPAGYPNGFNASYETDISVAAGETYLLVVSNYTNSTSGFTLNIDPSSPLSYTAPTQVIWSGGSGTTWAASTNWGGCATPSCTIDAVIAPAASNQPILTSGSYNTDDLTINSGSTLTLQAGAVLNICGNFYNYGSVAADPSSTIAFTGSGTQTISGSFINGDKIGNLLINKTSGSVILSAGIDIAGDFTTQTSTSVFNANGQYIKLAGNFSNASGSTTFTGVTNSTIEFNGVDDQNYNTGGSLILNNVVVNQGVPAAVVLVGNNMTISGMLTLTSGRIGTSTNEVSVTNNDTSALNAGNINSYVDGSLRRTTTATGSYNFPVGNYLSGKGYQLANINFTSSNTATDLVAKFSPYPSVPSALGVNDCGANFNLPALDNGSWTISSTPAVSSGTYTATLYNTPGTYTNSGGASGWTVMKQPSSGSWGLTGTCAASTISQVVRVGMSGFSEFGTAQSADILPVELVSFTGTITNLGNELNWITASEFNNAYFRIERSADGMHFEDIGEQAAAENASLENHYKFLDDRPNEGRNYYRLRQVNADETFSYSNVVLLENATTSPIIGTIQPNPSSGIFNMDVISAEGGSLMLQARDIFGIPVYKISRQVQAGTSPVIVNLDFLPKGIYLLECTLADYGFVKMEKIVIQ